MYKISVIVPVYNKKDTLKRAIDSILNQNINDIEIVVVDDGSTDGSISCCRLYEYTNIKVIVQSNRGVSAARNTGVANSTGSLIAFLDADDELFPGAIEAYFSMSLNFTDANFFTIGFDIVSESGVLYKPRGNWSENKTAIVDSLPKQLINNVSLISSSTVCMRREAFLSCVEFPEGRVIGEDIYVWLKMSYTHRLCHNGKKLARIYRNSENRSLQINKLSGQRPYYLDYYLNGTGSVNYFDDIYLRRLLFNLALKNLIGAKENSYSDLVSGICRIYRKHNFFYWLTLRIASFIPSSLIKIIRYSRSLISRCI
jgi:glycosyltransferase involved in cell wall biosynthesis